MHHRVVSHGVTTDYPVAYGIGTGLVGRSYFVVLGGDLFQSPASWYRQRNAWDLTPGYESARVLDFTQKVTRDCVFCHAGSLRMTADLRFFLPDALAPISCERCHGPGDRHRAEPSRANIVNPVRLAVRERDSICEQCHLKGAAAVLNPGEDWWNFRPGTPLESVATHYVERGGSGEIIAISHSEQLALSRCSRMSAGKLWCGTCHHPHGPGVADRKAQIRGICESCHAASSLSAIHTPLQTDCVECHMPRRPASDVAHAAITDHRIARIPAQAIPSASGANSLVEWHPAEAPFATRNLGLAYFALAQKEHSNFALQRAFTLLSQSSAGSDPAVAAAMGYMLLEGNNAKGAVTGFEKATAAEPESLDYWLDLGVAKNASGDTSGAIAALEKAIAIDAYDYRPYKALEGIYDAMNQPEQSLRIARRFLKLVPESQTMRLSQ